MKKHQATLLLLPVALTLALAACRPADAPADGAATGPSPAPAAAPADAAAVPADTADAPAIQGVSGTYVIDPSHTNVLAQWNHLGFSNPYANFGDVEGTIVYDADNIGASSVEVTLPLSGLNSFTDKFDAHLRNSDFFDAPKFPVATFRSTSVASAGGNKLTVVGDLTIKDITAPVTLDVTVNGFGEHPMLKRPATGFDATATIKRSDFGVGAYAPNVGDEVTLRITTEAVVAAPEGAGEAG